MEPGLLRPEPIKRELFQPGLPRPWKVCFPSKSLANVESKLSREATMRWRRRFVFEFAAGLGLYGALLFASIWAIVTWRPAGGLLYALAIVPLIGCLAVLWAVMRAVRQMDELERRVQFEALAFSFVATAIATFGWGFIENVGGAKLPAFGVWPIMAAFWLTGTFLANRRYR